MRVITKYADIPYELYLFHIEKGSYNLCDGTTTESWNICVDKDNSSYILTSYSTFEAAKKTMIDIQTAYSRGIKVFKIKEENQNEIK